MFLVFVPDPIFFVPHKMSDPHGGRYHFNNTGVIREIVFPNKAIIVFKLNGREEKAILLAKMLTVDGKSIEDSKHSNLDHYLKVGDPILFDCHIYDKGGDVGSGRDRCNFFAMRAWKNSREYERAQQQQQQQQQGLAAKNNNAVTTTTSTMNDDPAIIGMSAAVVIQKANNVVTGTGWISELSPRKGVLTFEYNGKDERALFLASKVCTTGMGSARAKRDLNGKISVSRCGCLRSVLGRSNP